MAPIATWFRRNGEQVIVHRCLGSDVERHCRVAADDFHVACMRLELSVADSESQRQPAADPPTEVSA